ncbi:uncharacterized protein LOC136027732 [Artemia franciscana]|uniref:uncharacterized protein LOC136027732 n=1 Tax=Artemia franciscana TaxID=6661 RepID=UPI0032DBBC1C
MYSSETTWSHVPRAKIRQWIHNKDVGQLQQMVLQNQGSRLLGETASSAAVRQFIQSIPGIMKMIQTIHSAAIGGDLAYFLRESFSSDILESRDRFGRTVLHKAISLGYEDLARHLIIYSRNLINFQDSDGRTPSHFCGLLSTREKRRSMLETLAQSGADLDILDKYGKRAEYYVMAPKAISPFGLSDLPEGPRNGGIRPTLKKASSLPPTAHTTAYSAPRDVGRSITVHPGRLKPIGTINDQTVGKIPKDNGRLMRSLVLILSEGRSHALNMIGAENEEYYPGEFLRDISLHAERIDALHSASSRGKLSRVRSIIESIGSIPTLKDSTDIFAKCRNSTKATPLHQAAVNSHVDIVKYLLGLTPDAIQLLDMDGRTPLHYAALGRNRESSTRIYKILVDFGADEAIRDKAGRLAKDYLQFNESVDKNKLKIPTFFPTFQYSLQDGDEHANSTRFLATSTFDEFRAKRVNLHDGSYMKRVPTQPNEEDSLVDGGQINIEESNKLASPPLGEMQDGKHGETEKNYHPSHHLQQHLGEMLPVIQEMNTSSTSNEEQNLNSAISSQKEEEFKNYGMVLECQPSKQQPEKKPMCP